MKQNKWLVISFIGVMIFFGLMTSLDCSREIHSWRGYKAVAISLIIGLGLIVSLITLLLQILKVSETPRSQIGGIIFMFIYIFVCVVTTKGLVHAYCS